MTGPLAPLFASLNETLESRHFVKGAYQCRYCWRTDGHEDNCPVPPALAALSAIERHVQDMEKALDYVARRKIALDALGLRHVADEAIAALSAREKEEE